jgi:hypothetical protein
MLAMVIVIALVQIQTVACSRLPTGAACPTFLPSWLDLAVLAGLLLCSAASVYRYWRDHIEGDYQREIEALGRWR